MSIDQELFRSVVNGFFFNKNQFPLTGHSIYKFIGTETADYLQRQLTVDIKKILNSGTLACRLDRTGRVFSFFYLINKDDQFYIVVDDNLAERTIEELNKFIIMEDITIEKMDVVANISTFKKENSVPLTLFDGTVFLSLDSKECERTVEQERVNDLITLTAWPTYNLNVTDNNLVNETRLNSFAVDYNKGCFLGQETAAKIETRRGAAKFPVLVVSANEINGEKIEIEGKKLTILSSTIIGDQFYYSCSSPRDFQINALEINNDSFNIIIFTHPIFDPSIEKLSETFFNMSVELFHEKKIDEAVEMLNQVIDFNPHYADAYESKGVILGNSGEFQKAIDVMDELLKVDENSVMAHTNKSLYLMKLGKIEEAEEEKALATVASFKRFGDEAKFKKEQEERDRAEKEDRARRFEMFNKVLAIDEKDVVANYGLADIHFNNDKYDKAMMHIDIVLTENPKYSVAYLLKSKILFKLKNYSDCLELIEKGIPIATSQGELMPANEMQALKTKIKKMG